MNSIAVVVGSVVTIIAILFFAPLLGVLGGAFAGWVVGLFFTDLIIGTLARFGVDIIGLEVWHLGAFLGFIGAFFKSSNINNTAK